MKEDTIQYYDKESSVYTEKRYPKKTISDSQYLFKKRRDIFLSFLEKIEKDLPQEAHMLEIGCADGIILKAIEERFPGRFKKLVGMDISPKMIEEAKRSNQNPRASFFVKNDLPQDTFDLVVELGVLPYELDEKLHDVTILLNHGGYFIYNLAGSLSSFARFKLRGVEWAQELRTYSFYDQVIRKCFLVEAVKVYGLFVPKLWLVPAIGRAFQPLIDALLGHIVPELFHEKIYLLKKK